MLCFNLWFFHWIKRIRGRFPCQTRLHEFGVEVSHTHKHAHKRSKQKQVFPPPRPSSPLDWLVTGRMGHLKLKHNSRATSRTVTQSRAAWGHRAFSGGSDPCLKWGGALLSNLAGLPAEARLLLLLRQTRGEGGGDSEWAW